MMKLPGDALLRTYLVVKRHMTVFLSVKCYF